MRIMRRGIAAGGLSCSVCLGVVFSTMERELACLTFAEREGRTDVNPATRFPVTTHLRHNSATVGPTPTPCKSVPPPYSSRSCRDMLRV